MKKEPAINVGMCFSRKFEGETPLDHIDVKLPTYLHFFELCGEMDWGAYVLTRKTYKGNGIFDGAWKCDGKKCEAIKSPVKMDVVYDRSAGVNFPPVGDTSVIWVNNRDFKILAWDKLAAYQVLGAYMPKTVPVDSEKDIAGAVEKINTEKVVLKPFNGLKGLGVFIGSKADAPNFKFPKNFPRYIAQEFVDTSGGIIGITPGLHDLRVAVVNGQPVWCHVRVPAKGTYLANAAQGGNLTEVDYEKVPEAVKEIVKKVSKLFVEKYDNPIFSLDFGMDKDGTPKIFEINDQIGFPKWEMKNREKFLKALVANFADKLARRATKE